MSIQQRGSFDRAPIYEKIKNYVIPPFAAGIAIVPVFHLLMQKSAKQTGKTKFKMTLVKGIQEGLKAAPTIGCVVGSQMIIQRVVEKILFNKQESPMDSFHKIFLSSMLVGAMSAPALAAFNAQTMKKSVIQSIKELSVKQLGAIMTREAGFLFSIRISDPIGEIVKEKLGNNPVAIYVAVFISAVTGALCSHPADTYLTTLQANVPMKTLKDSMKGSVYRATGIGCFAVLYKIFKDTFENRIEQSIH